MTHFSKPSALDIGLIDEVFDEIMVLEKNLSLYSGEVLSEENRTTASRGQLLSTEPLLSPSSLKGKKKFILFLNEDIIKNIHVKTVQKLCKHTCKNCA